jgi:hypothetical protein
MNEIENELLMYKMQYEINRRTIVEQEQVIKQLRADNDRLGELVLSLGEKMNAA